MSNFSQTVALLTTAALLFPSTMEGQKKKRDEIAGMPPVLDESKRKKEKVVRTEVLEVPKELPLSIVVDAQKLGFYASPLSSKGLLSQQVKDGLKALSGRIHGATIVNLRAFVTGTGDLRRVHTIVSENFSDKQATLPTLTVVQAGALPLEGAQVILEAVTVERKNTTPDGVAFLATERSPGAEVSTALAKSAAGHKAGPADFRRITCYVESAEKNRGLQGQLALSFPAAAVTVVQTLRDSEGDGAWCEAVVSAKQRSAGKLVLTGMQQAFGNEGGDVKVAVERLGKSLEAMGASLKTVLSVRSYSLSRAATKKAEELLQTHCPATSASTSVLIESLSSLDAALGLDMVAAVVN